MRRIVGWRREPGRPDGTWRADGRGVWRRTRHDLESARADWARACTLCEQIGARALLWRIHAALGQLAQAEQHVLEAERAFAAARTIIAELAGDMCDESFREHLRCR